MPSTVELIQAAKIIAIVRLERYTRAVEIARALHAGGIRIIEYTLTGSGALEAIAACRAALGAQLLVGAGTVLDAPSAHAAIDAGAQFTVTPALRPAVIAACQARGVPVVCGALTPSEALSAHELGAEIIKIFPAQAFGPQYIKDLLAPMPFLRLAPTGGIGAENARAYLQAGAVAVGIGSSLIPPAAVAAEDWGAIERAARACADAVA